MALEYIDEPTAESRYGSILKNWVESNHYRGCFSSGETERHFRELERWSEKSATARDLIKFVKDAREKIVVIGMYGGFQAFDSSAPNAITSGTDQIVFVDLLGKLNTHGHHIHYISNHKHSTTDKLWNSIIGSHYFTNSVMQNSGSNDRCYLKSMQSMQIPVTFVMPFGWEHRVFGRRSFKVQVRCHCPLFPALTQLNQPQFGVCVSRATICLDTNGPSVRNLGFPSVPTTETFVRADRTHLRVVVKVQSYSQRNERQRLNRRAKEVCPTCAKEFTKMQLRGHRMTCK